MHVRHNFHYKQMVITTHNGTFMGKVLIIELHL